MNVPATIAIAFREGNVPWFDLSTRLGVRDLYDVLEVILVSNHNQRVLADAYVNR